MRARPKRIRSLLFALLVGLTPLPSLGATEALLLDGAGDWVSVPAEPGLNVDGAITVEAWVRPFTTTGCQTIASRDFRTSWWLGICDGRLRSYTQGGFDSIHDGIATLASGEWTHVAFTFDGTTRRLYVDGVLDAEELAAGDVGVNGFDLGIGAEVAPGHSNRFEFEGLISELRIWSVARSQAEIRRTFIQQISTDEPNLVAAFGFDGSYEDADNRFFGVPVGDAETKPASDVRAIPAGDGLRIPIFIGSSVPTLDGVCSTGEYGEAALLPVWIDAPGLESLLWVKAAGTFANLYVCFDRVPKRSSGIPRPSTGVFLDLDADGGSIATSGDYRVAIDQTGDFFAVGEGNGAGGYVEDRGTGALALTPNNQEFFWSSEYRIPRSLLPTGPGAEDAVFGLGLATRALRFVGDDYGFPEGFHWQQPATWQRARIDNSLVIEADSGRPNVTVSHSPERPGEGGTITVRANAFDSQDLDRVEIWIDRPTSEPPDRVCFFPGVGDNSKVCEWTGALPVGNHTYIARAVDWRGKTDFSERGSLRVVLVGNRPELEIGTVPAVPVAGQDVTVVVTARDPGGLRRIQIAGLPAPALDFECTYSNSAPMQACATTFRVAPSQRWIRLDVTAENASAFIARGSRTILFDNGGPDTDSDGLSDEIEASLCTSPLLVDTDGDALEDGWEILGFAPPGAGRLIDLPALGANPCRKDIFLQLDYETGARVDPLAVEEVVATFLREGISFHIETNERPRPPGAATSPLDAPRAAFQTDGQGRFYFEPELNWTHYYAYAAHRNGRSGAWGRYFNFLIYSGGATQCNCPLDVDPSTCQNGRPNPACVRPNTDLQARTFMHELGHSFGLGHGGRVGTRAPIHAGEYLYYSGGWSSENHKPNYLSVMNYSMNGGALCTLPPLPGDTSPRIIRSLDYSQRGLGSLDEEALDERISSTFSTLLRSGDCSLADPGASPASFYTCSDPDTAGFGSDEHSRFSMMTDGLRTIARRRHLVSRWSLTGLPVADSLGVDWNCDGRIEASVSQNVNGDGGDFVLPGEICDDEDNDADGDTDEGCDWDDDDEVLTSGGDWDFIPSPPNCLENYVTSDACYAQPASYRSLMGAVPDCRPSGEPDRDCPNLVDLFDPSMAYMPIELYEELPPETLPDTEGCNGADDDGDGDVDEGCLDRDADGNSDGHDNCPETYNPEQVDLDHDGLGDACQFPAAPDGLTIDPAGGEAILTWTPLPDVAGYAVYRSSSVDPTPRYLGLGYPSAVVPEYHDAEAGFGSVHYEIRAVNRLGQEGPPARISRSGDSDGDDVPDDQDNCILVPNVDQADANAGKDDDSSLPGVQHYGDACDADLDDDGLVGPSDFFAEFRPCLGSDVTVTPSCLEADLDGDGVVAAADFFTSLRPALGLAPGPGVTEP